MTWLWELERVDAIVMNGHGSEYVEKSRVDAHLRQNVTRNIKVQPQSLHLMYEIQNIREKSFPVSI